MSPFATATDLLPEASATLGTLLRPFSLGHHLLLLKVGSPFANNPEADATPDQLAIAVAICAVPPSETIAAMLAGEWESRITEWLKQLRPRWWQRTRFSHVVEAEKFESYLTSGYSRPPVWRHDTGNAAALTAPWEQLLKCRLVAAGFDAAAVMEQFLPAAWYDYWTVVEMEQVANCTSTAKWRKIFYTEDDHARLHPPALIPE